MSNPSLKRDLQLLRMRGVLDPHRHYKKEGGKIHAPEFSSIGTVIEGPTEYISSRIPKRERQKTFLGEIVATDSSNHRFTRKYKQIQASKTSGRKAFYKKLTEKRSRRT